MTPITLNILWRLKKLPSFSFLDMGDNLLLIDDFWLSHIKKDTVRCLKPLQRGLTQSVCTVPKLGVNRAQICKNRCFLT
jgi:hypothetical protein